MMTARTERSAPIPTSLRTAFRHPAQAALGRPSSRAHHGTGRSLHLDIDHVASLSSIRGSLFDVAAPKRG